MSGEPVGVGSVPACWCGGALAADVAPRYRRCVACGSAVLVGQPGPEHFEVADDARDFYGRTYWTEYAQARNFPTICARARTDLSERCAFWLERVLEVVRPPGRTLEIGCGHGGFVRLLQEVGFDAMGTELSPWVVEFAKRTFDVPVLLGRLETLPLQAGFRCIAALDVLEHLGDPLDTMRRCRDLLAPDGVLLLQTPCYRGEGPGWTMFQPDEHIHLFTEGSVSMLLRRAGFEAVAIEPSLFPYDMWVVARPDAVAVRPTGEARIPAAFQALLDLRRQLTDLGRTLAVVDADRAERLAQVNHLTERLASSEADRTTRLEHIHDLTRRLTMSDADRAERLAQVDRLTPQIHALAEQLATSEADRAARLQRLHELTEQLATSEADRAARLEQIHALTQRLAISEADRKARLDVINALQAQLDGIRRSWVWRASRPIRPKERSG